MRLSAEATRESHYLQLITPPLRSAQPRTDARRCFLSFLGYQSSSGVDRGFATCAALTEALLCASSLDPVDVFKGGSGGVKVYETD